MANAEQMMEYRLAVYTSWGLWGAFGGGFVLSGFAADAYLVALSGFALLGAGFVSHLIINRLYGRSFEDGQVALAFAIFGAAVLAFIFSWLLDPAFSSEDLLIGLSGTALVIVGFLAYVANRFGLKGAFSMFHIHRE